MNRLREAGEFFLLMFNGDWTSDDIVHFCGPWCECRDIEHAKARCLEAWNRVVFHRRLGIAVVTRWTKYQRPAKQIALPCGVHNIFQRAWECISLGLLKEDPDVDDMPELVADMDIAGPRDTQAHAKVQVVRVKKADTLFKRATVFVDMCLALLGVVLMNPLVRWLFEDSKDEFDASRDDRRGPMFDFANPHRSKAVEALDAIAATLLWNPTHWTILRAIPGAWTASLRLRIQTMMLRLSAQVWFRLVLFYLFMPWTIARAVDDAIDEEDRCLASSEIYHANDCCCDIGAGIVIQGKMSSAESLVDDPELRGFVKQLIKHTKAQTIPVEEGFKRVRTNSASNSGNVHTAATISSNHILREMKSLHLAREESSKRKQQRQQRRGPRGLVVPSGRWEKSKKNLSVHNWMVSATSAKTPVVEGQSHAERMKQVLEEVKRLKRDPIQLAKFTRHVNMKNRKRIRNLLIHPNPSNDAPPWSPWGLGDSMYAFSEARLKAVIDDHIEAGRNPVDVMHRRWCAEFGDAMEQAEDDVDFSKRTGSVPCAQTYGVGFCQYSFSDVQRAAIDANKVVLNSIAFSLNNEFGYMLNLKGSDEGGAEVSKIVVRVIIASLNPEYQLMVIHPNNRTLSRVFKRIQTCNRV